LSENQTLLVDLVMASRMHRSKIFVDLLQLQFGSSPNHVVAGSYQTNV
jgi:hypothetical protein